MVSKFVGNLVKSNTYIVFNEQNEALIIDAGVDVKTLLKDLENKKVVGVLMTHCHFDHIAFLSEILKKYNCKAYISKNAKSEFQNDNLHLGHNFGIKIEMPKIDDIVFVSDGNLKVGNFNVEVILTPGHSVDGACYKINSLLFTGDTLFYDAIGRTDFVLSSVEKMISSLEKLKNIKFGTCLSGHGIQSSYQDQMLNIEFFINLLNRDNF